MPEIVLNPAVEAAFSQFVNILQTAVSDLRSAFIAAGYPTAEEARPQAMALMSKKYDVPLVESKSPFNRGEIVLDRSAPNFTAAKKALSRLMEALTGDADAEASASEPTTATKYEIPEEIAALAAALVAACREYDGMLPKEHKALAAQAVAQAFKAK